MAEAASCRHMPTEQVVSLALSSAHERLRERCNREKILAVLEDQHAAYDAHGLHSLLTRKYDAVEEQLATSGAAPSTLLTAICTAYCPMPRR